jgi:regulator of sirC expression with transglutaminase-like and TPR domain
MTISQAVELLARNPDAPLDVAQVALLLAQDEYPDLDIVTQLAGLNAWADQLRPQLRGSRHQRLDQLADFLFLELGFQGNSDDYYDPRNSYLNDVLERRTGIPITLSTLTMALGQRLDLNIVGVGLPGHFLVKLIDPAGGDVIFDPFHRGRRLSLEECETMVRDITGLPFEASVQSLAPCSLGTLAFRLLGNLRGIYQKNEDWPRAARVLGRMVQLDPLAPVLRRDLGHALARQGSLGKAVDHLAFYLRQAPEAEDYAAVTDLLASVKRQLAAWN